MNDKKGYYIVSDLIRYMGENPQIFYQMEYELHLIDIANIMDYMINGMSFKSALKEYSDEGEDTQWLKEILKELDL